MDSQAVSQFENLSLSPVLVEVVRELGYTSPTAIQAQSIPLILQGKDLIAQSRTGSGKTAAFSLPILERVRIDRYRDLQALILCPTRELCAQVAREIRKLGRKHPGLQVLILAGGTPIGPQFDALEKGVHIVVGTPGRVIDHLTRQSLDLSRVETVVLDEADRMLEMGFEEDMERILSRTPRDRQTVLFSATFPKAIESLSRAYQTSPARVTIADARGKAEADQTEPAIRQIAYEVEPLDRRRVLLSLVERENPESVLVFCNFKTSVADLAADLRDAGIAVDELHGDLEQSDRDRVMAKFRNKSLRILVATDVAARGIDVADLDLVVNFELPSQPEVYVHRVGRTGRAGKTGLAVSFYSAREKGKVALIERETSRVLERADAQALLIAGPARTESAAPITASMKTLYIAGGRKEKMRPGDILGALTGEAGGLDAKDIGKIEIHDRFSYVAVSATIAEEALEALRNGRIKGKKFRVEPVR
jgi:ATP-independent RNA helicase DbpA